MDHDRIECNCVWKGDRYKAPEQHADECPLRMHQVEAIQGTCADCKSVDESEGNLAQVTPAPAPKEREERP